MWYVGDVAVVEKNHALVVVEFLFTALAFICVVLRIYSRTRVVGRPLGLDDLLIVIALLGSIGFLATIILQIKYGLGNPDPSHVAEFLKSILATITLYNTTNVICKFSILVQCKRIFQTPAAQRVFLYLIVYMTLYGLTAVLFSLINCVPFAKYWNEALPGSCINRQALQYVLAGLNIVNDIMILCAPLPFLNNLQIARRSKIALMGVFACGGFACIVAIIRLHALYINNSVPPNQQPLTGVDIGLWSGLEDNVGIICACVPALKPLFTLHAPNNGTGSRSKGNQSRSHHSFQSNRFRLGSLDKITPPRSRISSLPRIERRQMRTILVEGTFQTQSGDGSSTENLSDGRGSRWKNQCHPREVTYELP